MNRIDTDLLKDSIPISDVVKRLGLKLNRQLQGDCPSGHESDGHKCFSINDKKNYYYCFHCNKSGDIISLVGLVLNKDFLQSIDWLKENFGYGNGKKITPQTAKQEEIVQELIEKDAMYELIYKHGKELLYTNVGREALNYLTLVRQYDYESLKKTDWIYYPKDTEIRKHLLSLHPESAKQISKLSLQGAYRDKFILAFPYRNRQGLITGFVKRAIKQEGIEIDGNMVRYDSTTGLSKYDLFNLYNCKGQEQIIIVEGYPEGLYFPTQGVANITAIGAGLLSKSNIVGLKEFGIKSVILCLDNDEAGIANTQEALKLLSENKINAVAIDHNKLTPHKDPDELFKANGIDAFINVINDSIPSITSKASTSDEKQIKIFEECTDYGNAERLVYYHGDNIRYCSEMRSWLLWDGKCWKEDKTFGIERYAKNMVRKIYIEAGMCSNDKIRDKISKHARSSESNTRIQACIALAKSEPGIILTFADLDTHKNLLNCQNGTIDLRTGELLPHRKTDNITKIIPVSYDKMAECPRWELFLDEVFIGDKDLIRFIQYALGYSLTASIRERCVFICYGRGANGKSKMLDTIEYIMGDYGKHVEPSTFAIKRDEAGNAREDIARLAGSRFISTIETSASHRLNEELIKKLSGDRLITARNLYEKSFSFEQTYKVWFATNHKPIIKGIDNAIWDRINLIPFNRTFAPEEWDVILYEKLIAEAPGILYWMIEGCLLWQNCSLNVIKPEKVKTATSDYRVNMNTLQAFIDDCCVIEYNAKVGANELYQAYTEWCNSNGEKPESKALFVGKLHELHVSLTSSRIGAAKITTWQGIGLLSLL